MATSREQALLGAFAALESAHFYSAFLPSVMTIQKFATDDQARAALRQGEAIATALALSLGYVLSELVDSPLPIVMSAGMAVVMVLVYEWAINGQLNGAAAAGYVGSAMLPVPHEGMLTREG